MVKNLMEMDEFNVSKLSNDKLQKFFDFLENHDYIKFFVWLNEKLEVEFSFDSAPKFFGKPAILLIQIQSLTSPLTTIKSPSSSKEAAKSRLQCRRLKNR